MSAGARGFLSKAAPLTEYIVAICTVMEGRTYLASDIKIDMIQALKLAKQKQAI
jgi:DNA-binding NarL/FixJ family response regulator